MGVDGLWDILEECSSNIQLNELKGCRVAVDASIWIYQLSSIQSQSSFLCDGLFRRLCKLAHFGIKPIFVFDGRPSELKLKTTRKRSRAHKIAQRKLSQLAKKALALKCLSRVSKPQHQVVQVPEPKYDFDCKESFESADNTELDVGRKRIAGSSRKVYELVKLANVGHPDKRVIDNTIEIRPSLQTVPQQDDLFLDSIVDLENSEMRLSDRSTDDPNDISTITIREPSPKVMPVTTDHSSCSNLSSENPSKVEFSPSTSITHINSKCDMMSDVSNELVEIKKPDICDLEETMIEEPAQNPSIKANAFVQTYSPLKSLTSFGKDRSSEPYRLDSEAVTNFKSLLGCFGFSWIVAPSEAEAQCAALQKSGDVDYVITDDSDALLFGASKVIRHLFSRTKSPKFYEISKTKYSQDMIIFLGSLLGTDYFEGIDGIGPKKALIKLSEICDPYGSSITDFSCLLEAYALRDKEYAQHSDFLIRSFYQAYKLPNTDSTSVVPEFANINEHSLMKFLSANTQIDNIMLQKELSLLSR